MRAFVFIISTFLVLWGVAGFIPHLATRNYLFHIFATDTLRNFIFLGAGFLGFLAAFLDSKKQRTYFQFIGIFFALWAGLGFLYGEKEIFGWIANNSPDNWLHAIISISALVLGYGGKGS